MDPYFVSSLAPVHQVIAVALIIGFIIWVIVVPIWLLVIGPIVDMVLVRLGYEPLGKPHTTPYLQAQIKRQRESNQKDSDQDPQPETVA